jgi:hypothetical protein
MLGKLSKLKRRSKQTADDTPLSGTVQLAVTALWRVATVSSAFQIDIHMLKWQGMGRRSFVMTPSAMFVIGNRNTEKKAHGVLRCDYWTP